MSFEVGEADLMSELEFINMDSSFYETNKVKFPAESRDRLHENKVLIKAIQKDS